MPKAKPVGSVVVAEGKLEWDYDRGAYIEDKQGSRVTLHNMVGQQSEVNLHPVSKQNQSHPGGGEPAVTVRVTVEVLAD